VIKEKAAWRAIHLWWVASKFGKFGYLSQRERYFTVLERLMTVKEANHIQKAIETHLYYYYQR
jgi:hypothetical protein